MNAILGRLAHLGTIVAFFVSGAWGAGPSEGGIGLTISNNTKRVDLPLVSGIDQFQVLTTPSLDQPFSPVISGSVSGYTWLDQGLQGLQFFTVQMLPKDSNSVLSANLLNRIAYGPTPDDLERVSQIGPQAYLTQQLTPESIQEDLEIDRVVTSTDWQYVTMTGTASSSTLYVYLTAAGDCYIDDLTLVSGSVPGAGVNRIRNGGFELGLTNWTVSPILSNSVVVTDVTHSGTSALHVISTGSGSTRDSSIYQVNLGLTQNQTYTLSYWYKPGASRSADLVIRLSNSGIVSSPGTLATRLETGVANLDTLRAWHVLHAVQSQKQLLEVLLQWLENHFVTQHRKSSDYLDRYYSGEEDSVRATRMEYMENKLWRQALLNPQCTFYDLLKISAESPAMIIYLDTVGSRGDGTRIANENYARELLELFTFGVDNGYDQNDITVMSRVWTGWTIRLFDPANEFNPFAPQSTTLRPGGTNVTSIGQLEGVWGFYYNSTRHNNSSKVIFPAKTVPARFGAPYAGRNYQLSLPARSGTNSIQDGYQAIRHLADQPFTQEYISVKLCRLFVHDDFEHGHYDYTDPNLSPEGRLVRDCMRAWEENMPKGQIRKVLEVILNSELFRTQAASMQKVKNPLEFTIGSVRALRALATDGTYTANTDGLAVTAPLNRMGGMRLFDRDDPDGYPEGGAPWVSAGTLAERLRFVQALLTPIGQSRGDAGNNTADPVKLLKAKLPAASWNNAAALADYFLGILFPAEGRANLDEYRNQAISFLNTADDGVASSPLSALLNTSVAYDTRVRGMVAMLLTLQRFQEQ